MNISLPAFDHEDVIPFVLTSSHFGLVVVLQRKSDLPELVNQTSSRLLAQTTTYWHQNQRCCLEKVPRSLSASTNLASPCPPKTPRLIHQTCSLSFANAYFLLNFSHGMCRTLTEVAGFNLLSLPPFPLSFDDESSLLLSASFPFLPFESLAAPFFLSGAITIHSSMAQFAVEVARSS